LFSARKELNFYELGASEVTYMHIGIAPQGSQRTPATCIAATTPELTFGILKFSVLNFKKFLNFK